MFSTTSYHPEALGDADSLLPEELRKTYLVCNREMSQASSDVKEGFLMYHIYVGVTLT